MRGLVEIMQILFILKCRSLDYAFFIYALQSAFDDVVILIVGCCRTYTHYKKVHYFKVSVSAFPAFMHSVQQLCPFEVNVDTC